jgi:hypothetical protein
MTKPIEETLPLAMRYDPTTGKLYWRDDWYPSSRTTDKVGWSDKGYIRLHHRGRLLSAHRVIWFLHYGEWPPKEIDHIDGNGLNNRIENLRLADRCQNSRNRPKYKCNKSGYKGVFRRKNGRFQARIGHLGSIVVLGSFACPIEAAKAYDRKAIELHGQYAKTNFPIEH